MTYQDLIGRIEAAIPERVPGLLALQKEIQLPEKLFFAITINILNYYCEKGKPNLSNAKVYESVKWYLGLIAEIQLLFKNPSEGESLSN